MSPDSTHSEQQGPYTPILRQSAVAAFLRSSCWIWQTRGVQREQFLEQLASLRMASRGGSDRYPHKPLLLLWLLGRIQQQGTSSCAYEEAEKPVSRLIDDFGPPSKKRYRAAMPFFHLESDLWEVNGDEGHSLSDSRASLCRAHATGRLRPEVQDLLRKDPSLIAESARLLIDLNFTPTYLEPICAEAGLDLEAAEELAWRSRKATRMPRRPGFRSEVLHGWRNRCAMCGYDGALGRDPAGLDAAHVFWHSQGGPDDADNGLALCALHHVLFDLGALGLTADLSIQVSPHYVACSEQGERLVYHLEGRSLLDPAPRHPAPSAQHVEWHSKQVFKTST
jgi:putative restriction endonuclease